MLAKSILRSGSAFLSLVATAVFAMQPVAAFSLSCPWGKCPPKKKKVLQDTTRVLIFQLAANPSLMNLDYLKYVIGLPEEEKRSSGPERHYFWYDIDRTIKYQLDQTMSAPGQVVQSSMVIDLEGTGLTFAKLHKEISKAIDEQGLVEPGPDGTPNPIAQDQPGRPYKPQVKKFFDYNGRPNELFCFAPGTYLTFDCVPNSFRLNQAHIVYRGAPLPPPTQMQMEMAAGALTERARLAAAADAEGYRKTKPGKKRKPSEDKHAVASAQLMPMLIQRVRSQPLDPEAHLMLAQALKREAHLNEAISEYKIALAISGDLPEVRDQALAELKSMMVLPDDNPPPTRDLKILKNGRMCVAGVEPEADSKKKKRKKDKDDVDE